MTQSILEITLVVGFIFLFIAIAFTHYINANRNKPYPKNELIKNRCIKKNDLFFTLNYKR